MSTDPLYPQSPHPPLGLETNSQSTDPLYPQSPHPPLGLGLLYPSSFPSILVFLLLLTQVTEHTTHALQGSSLYFPANNKQVFYPLILFQRWSWILIYHAENPYCVCCALSVVRNAYRYNKWKVTCILPYLYCVICIHFMHSSERLLYPLPKCCAVYISKNVGIVYSVIVMFHYF